MDGWNPDEERRSAWHMGRWLLVANRYRDVLANLSRMRIYEIIFFSGLAIHFAPFLLGLKRFTASDSAHGVMLVKAILPAVVPSYVCVGLGYAGCVVAVSGISIRMGACLCLIAFQTLWARNSAPVQTLALCHSWNVLTILSLWGGTRGVRLKSSMLAAKSRRLVVITTAIGVFFSGVEKLYSGWFSSRPMTLLLSFPEGNLMRNWTLHAFRRYREEFGLAASAMTVVFELSVPPLVLLPRVGAWVAAMWLAFFVAVGLMIEVPLLFLTSYGAVGILLARHSSEANEKSWP
jgi:hypothetical protein